VALYGSFVHAGAAELDPSVTADFALRDRMPQSMSPKRDWYLPGRYDSWGPRARRFPPPAIPVDCDSVAWQRARVVAVARKYIGLPYQHHHIPGWSPAEGPGLDCSNFTSWVYNYGLGVHINSDVSKQAQNIDGVARRLADNEPFAPGDLLFILKQDRSKVSHVVIFIDEQNIIDAHKGSVAVRPFTGWYRTHLSHALRVVQ
jgi:hypothetical protein